MSTHDNLFEPVTERGWRRGLVNLLDNEFGRWWQTRLWWTQALIWVGIINFVIAAIAARGAIDPQTLFVLYAAFGGIVPGGAVIVQMQSALVGEKSTGTAAWVLSKPASRTAFILAKLIANAVSMLVTMVLIPGVTVYFVLSIITGGFLNPLLFLAGQGVIWLSLIFYLAFTLMLGAYFDTRGPVTGFALGLFALQEILFALGVLPQLRFFLPWTLMAPVANSSEALLPMLLQGLPVASFLPQLLIIFLESVLFVVLAVRRFNKEEL